MIDTGTFVAGVGVLVTMDVLSITALFHLAGKVGHDPVARKRANKALKEARNGRKRAD